jgi:hypothetical protein
MYLWRPDPYGYPRESEDGSKCDEPSKFSDNDIRLKDGDRSGHPPMRMHVIYYDIISGLLSREYGGEGSANMF